MFPSEAAKKSQGLALPLRHAGMSIYMAIIASFGFELQGRFSGEDLIFSGPLRLLFPRQLKRLSIPYYGRPFRQTARKRPD